jgi:hypothetical protein
LAASRFEDVVNAGDVEDGSTRRALRLRGGTSPSAPRRSRTRRAAP